MSPIPATMDFSDFMMPASSAESVDFGSLAQQMMANLTGNGRESLKPIETRGTPRSPASPSPASMTQFSSGPLIEDPLLEVDEEKDDEEKEESRPTSTASQKLVVDLSTPLRRASKSSQRSASQRSSVYTDRSSIDISPVSEVAATDALVAGVTDDSSDEFATPGSKASEIFDSFLNDEKEEEEEGDTTAETILGDATLTAAELPPSPSQIM